MNLTFKTYLNALNGTGELVFCPNVGNAGDSLIASATFQLFDQLQLPFTLFDPASFVPEGKILIYGGGGNLVHGETVAWRFIERYHQAVERLVVLPHTICGHADLLASLGSNVDLFARERVSYEHISRCVSRAHVFLEDDLALGLNASQILDLGRTRPYRRIPLKRIVRRDTMCMREVIRRACGAGTVLNCFRTDRERPAGRVPRWNVDLSKLFKCGTQTPESAWNATRLVFQFIDHYEEIRTNRLHMAVAGALLGKRVKFYSNNYYKCEAVYHYSLKDAFPNVEWMGD